MCPNRVNGRIHHYQCHVPLSTGLDVCGLTAIDQQKFVIQLGDSLHHICNAPAACILRSHAGHFGSRQELRPCLGVWT